jgi:hypothetical protein
VGIDHKAMDSKITHFEEPRPATPDNETLTWLRTTRVASGTFAHKECTIEVKSNGCKKNSR